MKTYQSGIYKYFVRIIQVDIPYILCNNNSNNNKDKLINFLLQNLVSKGFEALWVANQVQAGVEYSSHFRQ